MENDKQPIETAPEASAPEAPKPETPATEPETEKCQAREIGHAACKCAFCEAGRFAP